MVARKRRSGAVVAPSFTRNDVEQLSAVNNEPQWLRDARLSAWALPLLRLRSRHDRHPVSRTERSGHGGRGLLGQGVGRTGAGALRARVGRRDNPGLLIPDPGPRTPDPGAPLCSSVFLCGSCPGSGLLFCSLLLRGGRV